MIVETVRRVVPHLGFPALRGRASSPLGWPREDGVFRSDAEVEGGEITPADNPDVSRETAADRPDFDGAPASEPTTDLTTASVDDTESAADQGVVTVNGSDLEPGVEDVALADSDLDVSRETSDADVSRETTGPAEVDAPLAHQLSDESARRQSLAGKPLPRPRLTRILTVANQKGGVGKTTTTVNVAAALAQARAQVLVVDLDPQGNASTALGIEHHAEVPSIYDVLVEGKPLAGVVQQCPDIDGLHCAPATIDLAGAEIELVSLVARETRLKKAIAAYAQEVAAAGTQLDYVFVDCPPSLGLLTVNAFVAATEVFIPIQCEYYALEGLSQLLKNIELIRDHLSPDLHVSTILLTMYDGRTRLSAQVADEVRSHFPDQTLKVTVPRSVRISEAPSHGQTVMTYDPASTGALSYLEAASEIAAANAAPTTKEQE